MNLRSRKTVLAATVLGASTFVILPALPAQAASVPNCVKVSVDDYKRSDIVHVKNTCTKGYSIKVIWAHETDSQCEYLPAAAGTMNSERNWPARFDGLAFC